MKSRRGLDPNAAARQDGETRRRRLLPERHGKNTPLAIDANAIVPLKILRRLRRAAFGQVGGRRSHDCGE